MIKCLSFFFQEIETGVREGREGGRERRGEQAKKMGRGIKNKEVTQ